MAAAATATTSDHKKQFPEREIVEDQFHCQTQLAATQTLKPVNSV